MTNSHRHSIEKNIFFIKKQTALNGLEINVCQYATRLMHANRNRARSTIPIHRIYRPAGQRIIKPRPWFSWRGFLLCVCLSVCVCVSVSKISKKILNRSTSFLAGTFPLTQRGNHSTLKKNRPGES